jgi:hypothetical protein
MSNFKKTINMKKSILLLACFILSIMAVIAQISPRPIPRPTPLPFPKVKVHPQISPTGNFVFGTVTDERGNPVEHALVLAKGTSIANLNEHGHYTNKSGYFHFDIPEGTTAIVITQSGYETLEAPVVLGINVMIKKKVKTPTPIRPIMRKITVKGTVKDISGNAVQGAKVKAYGDTSGAEATTDANGKFSFQVRATAQFLIVNANGFLEKAEQKRSDSDMNNVQIVVKSFMINKPAHVLYMTEVDEHLFTLAANSRTIPNEDVTWLSSGVVTAGADGLITPICAGNGIVTATRNNVSERCQVTVLSGTRPAN